MNGVDWFFSVVLLLGILFILFKLDKIERMLKDIKKDKETPPNHKDN
jgi:hypothetical protein